MSKTLTLGLAQATLTWKPLVFLSHIKRRSNDDRFSSSQWESFFCSNLGVKAFYRSMGTTGDPVPSGHRAGPDHHFTG